MSLPFLPVTPEQIRYYEGNLGEISDYPVKIWMGIYIIVISGSARLNCGAETYDLRPEMEVSFYSGAILQCYDRSEDFHVRMFTYTREIFIKAAAPIDHAFYEYNEEHPTYVHTDDPRSRRTWKEMLVWMDMAQVLFSDYSHLKFPQLQEETFLQGFWLWNFSTIQERIKTGDSFTAAQLVANRFIRLVKNDAIKHRRVEYYAKQLNVTTRYLNKVIRSHTHDCSPKQIIDAQLVAEIKERLIDATYTITQIAEMLHFPDQSYLSRFFRKNTGMSPMQYRSTRLRFQH